MDTFRKTVFATAQDEIVRQIIIAEDLGTIDRDRLRDSLGLSELPQIKKVVPYKEENDSQLKLF